MVIFPHSTQKQEIFLIVLIDPRNNTSLVVAHFGDICNDVETDVSRTVVSL